VAGRRVSFIDRVGGGGTSLPPRLPGARCVDWADGHVVFARLRTDPSFHPQHQAVPSADPWSRGRAPLSVAHGPIRDGRVRGDASGSDARAAQSTLIQEVETVR
jgi:hypothetical protein